jgi:hypothetical protein
VSRSSGAGVSRNGVSRNGMSRNGMSRNGVSRTDRAGVVEQERQVQA